MTPLPNRKNTMLDKFQTGLVSLLVVMAGVLINTAGNIYKNTTIMKVQMDMMQDQQHDATIERNNMRLEMADIKMQLSKLQQQNDLSQKKNTN